MKDMRPDRRRNRDPQRMRRVPEWVLVLLLLLILGFSETIANWLAPLT